jgi:hypothetical protein
MVLPRGDALARVASMLFLRELSPRDDTGDAPFDAIHKHLPTDELRDFFEFAYLCGTRKKQLAATTWAHLNSETWVLP